MFRYLSEFELKELLMDDDPEPNDDEPKPAIIKTISIQVETLDNWKASTEPMPALES